MELEPDNVLGRWVRGLVKLAGGAPDEGLADLEKALAMIGRRSFFLGLLGYGYGVTGRTADARNILDELEGSQSVQYVGPLYLALTHLGLGEHDAALDCLERSLEERDPMLMPKWLAFDPVRNHPRSQKIVEQMLINRP